MASNKRTIYLGLDYSQFTGGITEVNRKMGLLDAEFKLAQEQAKNYGNATDQVALKQEYLSQKIALQTQKVEQAKQAYEAVANSQNASQKEIDALNKKYIQEQTALEKLNGQLKDEKESTDKAAGSTRTFGDDIRDLGNALGLNASPAVEAIAQKFDGLSSSAGKAILAIGAVGGKLYEMAKNTAESADKILTLSMETGIATDELQKLQYASELIDVDVSTMANSMERMIRTMNSAREGTKGAEEAFTKLGIRYTTATGELRDANEVFYEVIDRLGTISNETERDALAMEVFGKSARDLNPLIIQGSARLKELGDEAERTGKIMSGEELAKAGQLSDALERMEKTGESLKNSLALMVIPVLTGLFEAISAIPVPVLQTLVVLATVAATIVGVVKAIKSMTDTASTIKNFFTNFDMQTLKTTAIVLGIVAALIALGVIISTIAGKTDQLVTAVNSTSDMMKSVTNTVNDAQKQATYTSTAGRYASGTDNFPGGRTWVGEAGPELLTLPRGSKITPASKVGSTEYNTFYVTIDAKNVSDFNKVVELAKNQRMAERRM